MFGEFCSFVGNRWSAGANFKTWPSDRRLSPAKEVGVIHAKL